MKRRIYILKNPKIGDQEPIMLNDLFLVSDESKDIGPTITKTSDLENDGDGTNAFLTSESQFLNSQAFNINEADITFLRSSKNYTLDQVTTNNNLLTKAISWGWDPAQQGDQFESDLFFDKSTYNMSWGGLGTGLKTGKFNIGFGVGALNQIAGSWNLVTGYYSGYELSDINSNYNTFYGHNIGGYTKYLSSNVFIGGNVGSNLKTEIAETDLTNVSPVLINDYKGSHKTQSGYDATKAIFNNSLNTFVGMNILNSSTGPSRAIGSVVVGYNSLSNIVYRLYNTIILGTNNYSTVSNSTANNAIIIGNNINLNNVSDCLIIDNNKTTRTNDSNALIYGNFTNRTLRFNASISIGTGNIKDADVTTGFDKEVYYNSTTGELAKRSRTINTEVYLKESVANTDPSKLWSDGTAVWFNDKTGTNNKLVYSRNLTTVDKIAVLTPNGNVKPISINFGLISKVYGEDSAGVPVFNDTVQIKDVDTSNTPPTILQLVEKGVDRVDYPNLNRIYFNYGVKWGYITLTELTV